MPARTLSLILGLWLFVSAFAWPRSGASFANAWIVGLLSAAVAVIGMTRARARFLNTALSAWLLASVAVLPHRSVLGRWNDVAVAVAMLGLSLVPGSMYSSRSRVPRPAAG
jgi:hypothetical protein